MKQRPDINQKVEEILQSLDGMKQAAPAPWFYTRVMAKLRKDEKTGWMTMASFLSRPAVAIAGLCIILVMNAVLLLKQDNQVSTAQAYANQDGQVMSDNEAVAASTSSFDYENLVQP
ncbi:MAG TPA: hypothetical protein VK644_07405 [Chitinophagaceae bacterium]|jgi:hypothetical protein|nr:hypothetical protein [Chitinophagaceae bacterium]